MIDKIGKVFASNVRMMRKRNDMTMEHLGRLTGMRKQGIYRIEKGKNIPSLETALRIAEALDVEWDELFKAHHIDSKIKSNH